MASSNTANWPVYSRKRKANVEELSWWFQGPKYLQFALRATRTHLTPTSYQQSRQLFIRHKLARQSKIRELLSGKKKNKPKKQQLREERRPLIDRDALRSVCQLQTPDGRNSRSSWSQELLQAQMCSCFSTREFWDGPQECSTWMRTEWWETVFNLFNLLQTGGDSDLLGFEILPLEQPSIGTWRRIYALRMSSSSFNTFLWHDWGCWRICNVFIKVHICSGLLKHYKSLISSGLPCCCGFCRSSVSNLVPSSGQNAESIVFNGD